MLQKELILEYRKLMAEFMGGTYEINAVTLKPYTDRINLGGQTFMLEGDWLVTHCLRYDESYDELMKVWVKFRNLKLYNPKDMFEHSKMKSLIDLAICYRSHEEAFWQLATAIKWFNIIHSLPMDVIDGNTLLATGFNNAEVEVISFPVTDIYCKKGDIGTVSNGQIRVGGAWFPFDHRWTVRIIQPIDK